MRPDYLYHGAKYMPTASISALVVLLILALTAAVVTPLAVRRHRAAMRS